jgi:hypothetical protein
MGDVTISRVRMRELARPGRFRRDVRPGAASSRPGGADLVIISLLVAHGGVPGAIAEGTIAVAVVALFVAIWLRERRSGEEQDRLNDERRRDRE